MQEFLFQIRSDQTVLCARLIRTVIAQVSNWLRIGSDVRAWYVFCWISNNSLKQCPADRFPKGRLKRSRGWQERGRGYPPSPTPSAPPFYCRFSKISDFRFCEKIDFFRILISSNFFEFGLFLLEFDADHRAHGQEEGALNGPERRIRTVTSPD